MATVVLVHGIAQEQETADGLESSWLPALAGGIQAAGDQHLADAIWRDRQLDVRMAFYGDLFLKPGAQGSSTNSVDALTPDQAELAEQFADAVLANAADHAIDGQDRALGELYLNTRPVALAGADPQGPRKLLRPAMNALAGLRWFAPVGVGLAGTLVSRTLTQVSRYLTDDTLRDAVQQRVLDLIDDDTHLIVSHSLGTVVAYETLHRCRYPIALITLGSPLALANVVYPRLRPPPACVPASVTSWNNFADDDDLVAAHTDLRPYFPAQPGSSVVPVSGPTLDNGAKPHDATHYLGKRSVGTAAVNALTERAPAVDTDGTDLGT